MGPKVAILSGSVFALIMATTVSLWLDSIVLLISMAIICPLAIVLSVAMTMRHYRSHLNELSKIINGYLQSRNYDQELIYRGPKDLAPTAQGIASLVTTMKHQKLLTSLVKDIASIANSHRSFLSAAEAAIEQICHLTGWKASDLYLPDDSEKSHFQKKKRTYCKGLSPEQIAYISQDIKTLQQTAKFDSSSFGSIKKPYWTKFEADGRISPQFIVPITLENKTEAIVIFYGFPDIDINSGLFKIMSVVSAELSQVLQREKHRQQLLETTHLMVEAGKMATVGEMAAGIAHEINNPLQVIQGRAEQLSLILETDTPDYAIFKKVIESLVTTVERLASTISGLSNISYNESMEGFRSMPLDKILQEIKSRSDEKMRRKNINFTIPQLIDPSIHIQCLGTQIIQAIINFINNSVDAIAQQENPWIHVEYALIAGNISFSVTDCGLGISDPIRQRLMPPILAAKKSGRSKGLGLSISNKIAHFHGGRIYVDVECKNTCFVLEIPLKQTINRESA